MISDEGVRLGAEAARRLAETGLYEFEPGLTEAEFARIEQSYGFEFADDHRAFLAAGLPVNVPPEEGQTWSRPWPEWRGGDLDSLRRQLDWPVEGVLLDVEHNGFWYEGWGERPLDGTTALATAQRHLAKAPVLVPVYAHRYLPAGRGSFGHPVLSMWQTDIIYYGLDLVDYGTKSSTMRGVMSMKAGTHEQRSRSGGTFSDPGGTRTRTHRALSLGIKGCGRPERGTDLLVRWCCAGVADSTGDRI